MRSAPPLACIDVGSNTTRLLVADADSEGRLRELMSQRAFTRIGRSLASDGAIPPEKVAEVGDVVATQARLAREVGAERIIAVATAAIRLSSNPAELVEAVEAASGIALRVLSGEEEARYAFLGATRTLGASVEGDVAVLDVGGGSSEVAVGSVARGVTWSCSQPIGSSALAEARLRSDPPGAGELDAARADARAAFATVSPPPVDGAIAVGGSATSLRRVVGGVLDEETFARALRVLTDAPAADVAARFELALERARLLPAGVLLLEELSRLVGCPVRIGRGGLREGVLLDALGSAA